MKKKVIYPILVVAVIAIVFIFSSQPADMSYSVSSEVTQDFNNVVNSVVELEAWSTIRTFIWKNNRKIAHIFLFGCLGLCSLQCCFIFLKVKKSQKYAMSLIFCVVIALLDELHQLFVPGRGASLSDVGIDSIGILISLLLRFLLGWFRGCKSIRNERKS